MHPKWGTSPSLIFYFDIYGQQAFSKTLLQPDRSCKPHKIIGSLHTLLNIIFFQTNNFTHLLWTVETNLPKKLCPISKRLKHLNIVLNYFLRKKDQQVSFYCQCHDAHIKIWRLEDTYWFVA